MTADNSVTPARWLAQQIDTGDPDMLRSMVKTMPCLSRVGGLFLQVSAK
ncbi:MULTISPECIES: hypothetical protein [unclassified Nonomuraea]